MRADHTNNFGPVAILHRLQRRLEMAIFIRQRANKTRAQEGVRDSHPLLSLLVVRAFYCMKCLNGVSVGGNGEIMELVVLRLSRHLTLWVVPLLKEIKSLPRRLAFIRVPRV